MDITYGYIYLTQNNINGKLYVGQHKSEEYDPQYLGSGKILKRAIRKYGSDNFSQTILETCMSKEELDNRERYWIGIYKNLSPDNSYNLAKGGDGGDTLYYKSKSDRDKFREKMTDINRKRCSSDEFRKKISQKTSERYKNPKSRSEQSVKIKAAWSNSKLKAEQSERLKFWYKTHKHNTAYLKIKCVFELNGEVVILDSIKSLRKFLKEEYGYSPDNRTFKRLLEQGKNRVPFEPFHKNKLKELRGMIIYTIDDDVETNCDECSSVEAEMSAAPKDEALI